MSWVLNSNMGCWTWDCGPFLPAVPANISAPSLYTFPADAAEIDFVVASPPAGGPSEVSFGSAYSYRYRIYGGGTRTQTGLANTAGCHLYVFFYNLEYDDPETFIPSVSGPSLVPSSLAAVGTDPGPPPPPTPTAGTENDNFSDAKPLSKNYSAVIAWPGSPAATSEINESLYGGTQTLWYKWKCPIYEDPRVVIATFDTWDSPNADNTENGLDTVIRVYESSIENPTLNDLYISAQNDDYGNIYQLNSRVELYYPESGKTYYIQLGTYDDEQVGTLVFNFNVSIVEYRWSEWRDSVPTINERFKPYSFQDNRQVGLPDTLNNRGTGYVDGSKVLPSVDPADATMIAWTESYSQKLVKDGALPSSVETFYTTTGATTYSGGGGVSASTMLLSGGSIGGMWTMGGYSKSAWVLDMSQQLKETVIPSADPDYPTSAQVEYAAEGEFIDAKFVIINATVFGYANIEHVSPIFTNSPTNEQDPAAVFLFDTYAPWITIDIVELPESVWENSRRHEYGYEHPFGYAIRPFDQLRDDSNVGEILTTILPVNSSDPYETRYDDASDFYGTEGLWRDIPDYESPTYTELQADYSIVVASVPRAYNIGSMPPPPRSTTEIFANGYRPGSTFRASMGDNRGTTQQYTNIPESEQGYIGWVASWQPPQYRLLMPFPVEEGVAPPMRQRSRDDGLTTDARQERTQGSSQQTSIRRGGRTYY